MNVLLTLAAVHLVGMAVPGPNVVAVSQTAVASSRRAAIAVATGVATAALMWATTAQAGLAALLWSIDGVNVLLRTVGAALLIVLGARLIANPKPAAREAPDVHESLGHFYVRGIVVNLSNPKSLVYFTSIFTVLVPGDASPAIRIAAVVIVVAESASWHSLLALLFSLKQPRRLYARFGAWIDRAVGGIFVLVAARLLSTATR
jgi:threonine/homoserine/homoserine lactone efflux protein